MRSCGGWQHSSANTLAAKVSRQRVVVLGVVCMQMCGGKLDLAGLVGSGLLCWCANDHTWCRLPSPYIRIALLILTQLILTCQVPLFTWHTV